MHIIPIQYFKSPVGELMLGSFKDQLVLCDWRFRKMRNKIDQRIQEGLHAEFKEQESAVITTALQQLMAYFNKQRNDFDVPILMIGTDFQKKVWKELMKIPYGQTETYLGLAKKTGNAKAIRAVAAANGANAHALIIPCHRVLGSRGEIVGYAGGLRTKKQLLELETNGNLSPQLRLF